MADLRAWVGLKNPDRKTADGVYAKVRALRDGTLSMADFAMVSALEGRAFVGNGGTITTPITFGAGTIDTTEPDFDLSVPAGTLVIPLEIRVYMEAFGTSAQFECMASVGRGGAQGTDTNITPTNLRADAPYSTVCSVGVASDADATYMTSNVSEFWRDGQQFAITKTAGSATAAALDPFLFTWKWSDAHVPPIMYSASGITRLNVFAASQAGTGFITVKWLELPGGDA